MEKLHLTPAMTTDLVLLVSVVIGVAIKLDFVWALIVFNGLLFLKDD